MYCLVDGMNFSLSPPPMSEIYIKVINKLVWEPVQQITVRGNM
jgi:hypothetical protein